MTNTTDPINRDALRAAQDRRLADLRATPAPIMPTTVRRLPPRDRTRYRRRRTIR